MKRILINATHNEEIRVALCKGNHMYDFDLENRTREQKKSNIYKAHVTRVEPSLEAVFVEYGADRQGFLPIREIAKEYLAGNPRNENIRNVIKEGDTLIVQVEKEERGNKGAALSTYVSLAGRYLVLMPNNPRGGGISRQISGKQREEMKRIVGDLQMPKGMSVIIRTAGISKSEEDLQHDLNHLLNIWATIGDQNNKHASPRLVHQESGVVTRALRDYMRDDISEIWIDSANAYDEAVVFIKSVMPKQLDKVRKYTDFEPMFSCFGIEKQIETAYQREVRLPSGGSIVIDQTEAMVAIDINSAKSTKGSDVSETAYHTNLEAAEEIARQLRLRDMGGLVVIDFIDMYDNSHQKEVAKRLIDSTKHDRARVQFGEISKFGLMEMSRQRLRPSLEESTGYKCPRCHGTGMIRDLRSLGLSIMRQIEQLALRERKGEVQAEVPTDVAAFLLNEKRDGIVYLEQDSGTRITILPHAHMESPDYKIHYNPEGFAPSSYERISDSEDKQTNNRGYEVNWQNADNEKPEHQPNRQPRNQNSAHSKSNNPEKTTSKSHRNDTAPRNDGNKANRNNKNAHNERNKRVGSNNTQQQNQQTQNQPQAVAWLSNLFAPTPQAQTADAISSQAAAQAIESLVNSGGQSLGSFGQVDMSALIPSADQNNQATGSHPNTSESRHSSNRAAEHSNNKQNKYDNNNNANNISGDDLESQNKRRRPKNEKGRDKKERRNHKHSNKDGLDKRSSNVVNTENNSKSNDHKNDKQKREPNSRRESRGEFSRNETLVANEQTAQNQVNKDAVGKNQANKGQAASKPQANKEQNGRNNANQKSQHQKQGQHQKAQKSLNKNEVSLQVSRNEASSKSQQQPEAVHLSLDNSKPVVLPNESNIKTEASTNTSTSKKSDQQRSDSVNVAEKPRAQSEGERNNRSKNSSFNTVESGSQKGTQAPENTVASSITGSGTTTPAENTSTVKPAKSVEGLNQPLIEETKEKDAAVSITKTTHANLREDGRANNDPRVVSEALTKKLFKQLSGKLQESSSGQLVDNKVEQKIADYATPSTVSSSKITGNVGEFLRATLDGAEERIKTEGVIACFIEAMKQARLASEMPAADDVVVVEADTMKSVSSKALDAEVAEELAKFDFSNYGYLPLTENYLSDFRISTRSVGQYEAVQGKTEVAPSSITTRATNDPRGQHPEINQLGLIVDTSSETKEVFEKNSPVADSVSPENVTNTLVNEVLLSQSQEAVSESTENFDSALGNMLIEDVESVTLSEPLVSKSDKSVEKDVTEKHDNTSEITSTPKNKGESSQDRGKTTFDKYKSMLANVSEQMLNQGNSTSLFLSSQPVPKNRIRKTKKDED